MLVSNSTSSALANLLKTYQSQTATSLPPAVPGAPASSSPGVDTASFSQSSLLALEAEAGLAMIPTTDTQSTGSEFPDLSTLWGSTGPSAGTTDPHASLLGTTPNSGNAGADTNKSPAQLIEQAQAAMSQTENAMISSNGDGINADNSSASSDDLSSLLTSFGQSIIANDNLVIQKALARVQGSNHGPAQKSGDAHQ